MIFKTYKEIADDLKLDSITKSRYIEYMKSRWLETESQKCLDGYATEWALRFKNNMEYGCSDEFGMEILNKIDKNEGEI